MLLLLTLLFIVMPVRQFLRQPLTAPLLHVDLFDARRLEDAPAREQAERACEDEGPEKERDGGVEGAPDAKGLDVEFVCELHREVRVDALSNNTHIKTVQ